MTVYLNFYLILYLASLIKLNFLLINCVFTLEAQNSISYNMIYIWKFVKVKSLILLLFLSLTGLPPFIMFFIKFNYLINLLYKVNIIIILSIFLIFFFNMLFYIQIFFHKNNNITLNLKKPNKKINFNYINIYSIVWFIFFVSFSIFFFTDLIYIYLLIVNGNI